MELKNSLTLVPMDTFDDIRPYTDEEFVPRFQRLVDDPALVNCVCRFVTPSLYRALPTVSRMFVRRYLRLKSTTLENVDHLHQLLAKYMERLVKTTTAGFSYSGIEALPSDGSCLFISNHRDIALDACFVNYALWLSGRDTVHMAVGDNLFSEGFESEFMRLNKSFIVVRQAHTSRELYNAHMRTSSYIRKTLESNDSVWIAQREGRAKDGLDKTDPAILKMFMLAFRKDCSSIGEWLSKVNLVPVALSYEIDPCASRKAHELYLRLLEGRYEKSPEEDLQSVVTGIMGFKGRVHVNFSAPMHEGFESAEHLATAIDQRIHSGLQPFPTYQEAHQRLSGDPSPVIPDGRVRSEFDMQLNSVPDAERSHLLQQYANQFKSCQQASIAQVLGSV